jgi:hypothetical protein
MPVFEETMELVDRYNLSVVEVYEDDVINLLPLLHPPVPPINVSVPGLELVKYSRVDQLSDPTLAGAACTYFDQVSLKSFAATVTSVIPNHQIVINSPNGGGTMTFSLTPMDRSTLLPIAILN